jgi:4-amino-4-deoxy-L-arabinose transferase-like glycosyltransferase
MTYTPPAAGRLCALRNTLTLISLLARNTLKKQAMMTEDAPACDACSRRLSRRQNGEGDEVSSNSTIVTDAPVEAFARRPGRLGLLALATSIALVVGQVLAARCLELTFDEAYYALWSRGLSFGYLDHPPMVALLIRAATGLFGSSELGVRALSLLIVGAMPALIALIAWRLFRSRETAALAALMWIAMPLVLVGGVFVTPDAPLVVFWTLGLVALTEIWRRGDARWLIALGVALGLALQSKFTAAFFAAGVLLALAATPSLRRWLVSPALFASLALALALFAPFVAWNAAHDWATFIKQLGRAPLQGFTPYYVAEFLVAQIGLINPLVFAALMPAVATIPWRAPVLAGSRDDARRLLVCTIAPAAIYFLLHSTHDRVQGNWLAPVYPAAAILAADWVSESRRTGASGLSAAIAKAALWAAPVGLVVAGLAFADVLTGAVPLGRADPATRLEGFRELARHLDAKARANSAAYVLTQGYALTSLMTYYGDPAITVVQPEQRMRWIFEPQPPETLFASPGLALGEPGGYFDLILKTRFHSVEPFGLLERRGAGESIEAYELYRVADPIGPVLDPICPRGDVDLERRCQS